MTAVAALLFTIGVSDIVRLAVGVTLRWRSARLLAGVLGIVLGALFGLLGGLGAWAVVVIFVPFWLFTTRPGSSRRASVAIVGLLGLAIVVLLAVGAAVPKPAGPLSDWYATLPYAGLTSIPLETVAIVGAAAVFLIESANVVVRLALAPITAQAEAPDETPGRTMLFQSPEDLLELPLPGGRLIGPLERILILSLALAGQFTAIGAVVAAKGIIRFPEISRDTVGGSKAEFFIVGSLASWVLVAGAVSLAVLATG
ncbi:MAG TPA: hypothetical protein VNJ54_02720 [Plantibacter sp.]|uniref:hypothetical protein n=1 Tax=unclassified Plantibacter TaxID=2624265 RepID=UPI002CB98DD4|nr:hypothetical protein [Plantibacter sp.]